jgi:hypothetical protein
MGGAIRYLMLGGIGSESDARLLIHLGSKTPYCCHIRNQGLCASISSWRRFAAARAFGLSGLMSATAKMRPPTR